MAGTAYPAADILGDPQVQDGTFQNTVEQWLAASKEHPGTGSAQTLTIASGVATPAAESALFLILDTESAAASDDLDRIAPTNCRDGALLLVRQANAGRVITLRHNQVGDGKLILQGSANFALSGIAQFVLFVLEGAQWTEIARSGLPGGVVSDTGKLSNLPESIKTSGYTVVSGDAGSALIGNSASSITFAFTAAATLGAGFAVFVRNINTGAVVLDPNSTEQINGATTLSLAQNESALVWCTGTAFRAIVQTAGGGKWSSITESVKTGAYTIIASDAGNAIIANGSSTFTLSLTAVASMSGFVCVVRNVGSSSVVLDPNSTETINGATTLILGPNMSALLWCNGTDWRALVLNGSREILAANRTYYVRTDGNDSNDGLANSSGGAFLTIGAAISACYRVEQNGYQITIQIGNGTYTAAIAVSAPFSGVVRLLGDATTPSNVVISTTNASAITVSGSGVELSVEGVKLTTTTTGYGILVQYNARVNISAKVDFGAVPAGFIQVFAAYGGQVFANAAYNITGGGGFHWLVVHGGLIFAAGITITLTGTPAFSQFALAQLNGSMQVNGNTFSGSATGQRYSCTTNGIIDTAGSGASYLPGNSGGTAGTGGQYL